LSEHYELICLGCGKRFREAEAGFLLSCDQGHPPALLRSAYGERRCRVRRDEPGLFRYRDWLPARRAWPNSSLPAVFPCRRLSRHLGLKRLTVAFSGYWPERGAFMDTCSFKELEALPVLARIPAGEERALVVSSAGNTGRAFLNAASRLGVPAVVVVPESALPEMWLAAEKHPQVRLVVLEDGQEEQADYYDAIRLGATIAGLEGHFAEGGVWNVGRRDGMGTVLLAATEVLGELPQHYVQAVGSGTGGIAAWEMSLRLAAAGDSGGGPVRLHLVQNEPFMPMVDAWRAGRRELADTPQAEAKRCVARLHSRVLSNRRPPYALRGGVFDALRDSRGSMYGVGNAEAAAAGRLFTELEGCDLDPAAEVALAGLMKAVALGTIEPKDPVLLNLTGGGRRLLLRERRLEPAAVDHRVPLEEVACPERVAEILQAGAAAAAL
jgi:cysteate synthase